ncbi:hypothetical protein [Desulfopila aestuarii]|uniref:Methyl-accepting chemotaxis protein n=1 Tax=Desulfopila aestuarii DSM 18488 TaxID=1121416 RepID=A0A1M7XYV0_9BACT|nr:hypothetical protein [Desulfopila aestuarii]SHO44036.1 hypothetical protein SAMN02745220_00618 [Desulfopila aestuarii DSM 18488]
MRLTLKNKFLLPSLLLIFFGMGTSGTISYYKAKNAISDALNSQINQQAEETINLMDSWLNDQKRDIVYWSNRKDFVGLLAGTSSAETAVKDLQDLKKIIPTIYQ